MLLMSEPATTLVRPREGVLNALMKIDSSIRNGQFLYAHREIHKLYSELKRGEYGKAMVNETLMSSLRKTDMFLNPMVRAFSQNQASMDIARRTLKCPTK